MPIVTGFAALFFCLRYHIEKYNFLFVYVRDYDSHASMSSHVISYQICAVILFQLLNYSFIDRLSTNSNLLIVGFSLVLFQIICLIVIKIVHRRNPNYFISPKERYINDECKNKVEMEEYRKNMLSQQTIAVKVLEQR